MSLNLKKIDRLRSRILNNLKELEESKHLVRTHDLSLLKNHHNYILNTLDNMINIAKVEKSDPYNSFNYEAPLNTANSGKTVLYNIDGTTKIVKSKNVHKSKGEEWETVFDQKLLTSVPSTLAPPQYLTNINRINGTRQTCIFDGII